MLSSLSVIAVDGLECAVSVALEGGQLRVALFNGAAYSGSASSADLRPRSRREPPEEYAQGVLTALRYWNPAGYSATSTQSPGHLELTLMEVIDASMKVVFMKIKLAEESDQGGAVLAMFKAVRTEAGALQSRADSSEAQTAQLTSRVEQYSRELREAREARDALQDSLLAEVAELLNVRNQEIARLRGRVAHDGVADQSAAAKEEEEEAEEEEEPPARKARGRGRQKVEEEEEPLAKKARGRGGQKARGLASALEARGPASSSTSQMLSQLDSVTVMTSRDFLEDSPPQAPPQALGQDDALLDSAAADDAAGNTQSSYDRGRAGTGEQRPARRAKRKTMLDSDDSE